MPDIKELYDKLYVKGNPFRIIGCSNEEIDALQSELNITFPEAYRSFLLAFGKDLGGLFLDTEMFFDDLVENREVASEILEEENCIELLNGMFVFSVYHGFQFLCFKIGAEDDPPVFHYLEGNCKLEKISDHFSDYMACLIDDC